MRRRSPSVLAGFALAVLVAAAACGDDTPAAVAPASGDAGDAAGPTAQDGAVRDSGAATDAGSSEGGSDAGADADAGPPLPGLDARPANATCKAPARPPAPAGGDIQPVAAFPNMDFAGTAIGLLRSRLGASGPLRWFVVQRGGEIWTFVDPAASKDGFAADGVTPVEKAERFFTLDPITPYGTSGEGGLLGVAFDPDFGVRDDANALYVHYTLYPENVVARYRIGGAPGAFTKSAEERIFVAPSGGGNHWGGDLKFGPDAYLYFSLGDGGNGMTPADAQKTSWPRGKIMRIDPRSVATGYAVPPGNPFTGGTQCGALARATLEQRTDPCPEVFAYGFRNPWRMSFDRGTGRLWVGDVGTQKENVELVVAGKNHGWPTCDGVIGAGCPPASASEMIAPVAQYRESMPSASVAGGYVYRGSALGTALQGAYLFADVYVGQLWSIDAPYAHVATPFAVTSTYEHPASTSYPAFPKLRVVPGVTFSAPVSFAEDENAELYVVTFGSGRGQAIFKLVPPGAPAADTIPTLLSETGCADPADPKKATEGMIPYDLVAPFWSDGADKTRWLAIPDGTTIATLADGDLDLPNGAVLRKDFRALGKLLETRLFVRHLDGGWAGYTYVWNDAETNATKANPLGESRSVGAGVWRYPSRAQCLGCHTSAAGGTLGLELRQLNRDLSYPATGRTANQIDTLAHVGMLAAVPGPASSLAAFVAPFGTAPLEERARVYLHVNCSGCHRGTARPSFHFDQPLAQTELCAPPALLVPGDAGASRLATILRDPDVTFRMPKNGGVLVDDQGAALIESWIGSRATCP